VLGVGLQARGERAQTEVERLEQPRPRPRRGHPDRQVGTDRAGGGGRGVAFALLLDRPRCRYSAHGT
jgi:hypothetical protein